MWTNIYSFNFVDKQLFSLSNIKCVVFRQTLSLKIGFQKCTVYNMKIDQSKASKIIGRHSLISKYYKLTGRWHASEKSPVQIFWFFEFLACVLRYGKKFSVLFPSNHTLDTRGWPKDRYFTTETGIENKKRGKRSYR